MLGAVGGGALKNHCTPLWAKWRAKPTTLLAQGERVTFDLDSTHHQGPNTPTNPEYCRHDTIVLNVLGGPLKQRVNPGKRAPRDAAHQIRRGENWRMLQR
jgi:hypothetical protein